MSIKTLSAAILMLFTSVCFAAPVNINTADAEALATLNGIGPVKAAAIIADRDTNGPFATVEDLERVKGIGKTTVELNKEMMTVTEEAH